MNIYSSGNGTGWDFVRELKSAIKFSFHFFLWTCHVPKPKVVAGMVYQHIILVKTITKILLHYQ